MVSVLRRRLSRLRGNLFAFGKRGGRSLGRGWSLASSPPPKHLKSREELLKNAATFLTGISLFFVVGGILTPLLSGEPLRYSRLFACGIVASLLLGAARLFLRYIPNPNLPEDQNVG